MDGCSHDDIWISQCNSNSDIHITDTEITASTFS